MDTAYGVNAPEAVKLWSRKLAREALKKTYAKSFMGPGSDSLIQIKNDTKKSEGDRIRVTLRMQLTGDGTQGDDTLEGNEEALTTFTDDFVVNQLRHGTRSQGKMTEQRIPFSIRDESMMGLSDWWADRWDTWLFNQLCSFTPVVDTRFSGHNAVTAATRQVWPNAVTNDEGLNAAAGITDRFELTLIDKAIELAKTGTTGTVPPIRPVMVDGEKWYVVFLHTYQVTSLRVSNAANKVTWYDLQKAQITGGVTAKNPIFTGALGTYNGCILHESTRMTQGVSSATGLPVTTARRAILCGAQAAITGFGRGDNEDDYNWFEQMFDYGNKLGVKAGCISGLKKSRFNSQDFGVVVMSSKALQGDTA
jgi:N4-gp56 family major capsid protein